MEFDKNNKKKIWGAKFARLSLDFQNVCPDFLAIHGLIDFKDKLFRQTFIKTFHF